MSTPIEPRTARLEIGAIVRTPSGAFAEVVAVFDDVGEALVQWSSGDRARFRFSHLKALPGAPE